MLDFIVMQMSRVNREKCKQCNENDHFCHFQIPHMKSAKKLFPGVKFETKFAKMYSRQTQKFQKSAKLNSCEIFMPHAMTISLEVGIVNVLVFQVI